MGIGDFGVSICYDLMDLETAFTRSRSVDGEYGCFRMRRSIEIKWSRRSSSSNHEAIREPIHAPYVSTEAWRTMEPQ
jgi:hypothetical protein